LRSYDFYFKIRIADNEPCALLNTIIVVKVKGHGIKIEYQIDEMQKSGFHYSHMAGGFR
jgi:2',3'-cyclic-nucleotide 2'-phosphodiesterase (5'-nucleotidase family)